MKQNNLRTKIISRLAILCLCAMSILLLSMYTYISHTFKNDLINRGRFLAVTIGELSVTPLLAQKHISLALMLTDTKAVDRDLAYLFIMDPKGKVLVHSFGDAFPVDLKKIDRSGKSPVHRIIMDGQGILDITSPILRGTLGTIHAGMSEARINGELKRIFSMAAAAIVVAFITAAWLLWLFLERIIISPIKMLEQAFRKVQDEGLETPVTVVAEDEIGQLGNSFNQMARHLSEVDLQRTEVIAKLNESNRSLGQMILERKEAEEENRNLQVMLLQSQKMDAMGTLAGGIAHDFNNILTGIYGFTEIAKIRCGDNAKLSENLDQIMVAAGRARDLVKQILTFSRKNEIRQRPLVLNPLITETLKLIRSSIPATIDVKQKLDSRIVAFADTNQIHQVLMNLCTNAYHAMAEKGGTLTVTLKKAEYTEEKLTLGASISPGRYAVIEVSDTGCGMDSATKQKIFDPYFTTKAMGKGSGLGLAVVHGIVKAHGGKITVYSEPGRGSTFRVYLPLANGEVPVEQVAPRQALTSGHGECIVFVDDERQIRDIAEEILTINGYRVELYSDAIHALEHLKENPSDCDLLVTDMAMPGMNGRDLARHVLELRPDLPIILCTGYSELIDRESAKRTGIKEYLQKPVAMSVLCERIRMRLDESEATRRPAKNVFSPESVGALRSV